MNALATVLMIGFLAVSNPLGASSFDEAGHGGGCRKSSPPGQCCHMDNSVGRPHCH